jgi:hypothetical protein
MLKCQLSQQRTHEHNACNGRACDHCKTRVERSTARHMYPRRNNATRNQLCIECVHSNCAHTCAQHPSTSICKSMYRSSLHHVESSPFWAHTHHHGPQHLQGHNMVLVASAHILRHTFSMASQQGTLLPCMLAYIDKDIAAQEFKLQGSHVLAVGMCDCMERSTSLTFACTS